MDHGAWVVARDMLTSEVYIRVTEGGFLHAFFIVDGVNGDLEIKYNLQNSSDWIFWLWLGEFDSHVTSKNAHRRSLTQLQFFKDDGKSKEHQNELNALPSSSIHIWHFTT